MELNFEFINKPTEDFYNCPAPNICLSGGYGSGKTYAACMKIITLVLSFNNYQVIIGRLRYKALKDTTLKTFKKICPPELYTFDPIHGKMTFRNGSEILWMHLDVANEQTLRGIEPNTVYLDQPEELTEQIYTTLSARVGRWDKAEPTNETLALFGFTSLKQWPRDPVTKNLDIPSYMLLTPNPDNETHWIWRIYHPDSPEHSKFKATHKYFEVSSTENPKLAKSVLDTMLRNDPSWVARFVHGKWGISEATIHILFPQSIIDPPKEWIENFLQKATLYRVLDHGESAATCMLWFAAYKGIYICYREYYQPGKVITYHRKQIEALSRGETYFNNWADPQIFKMTQQKYGGMWSIADEYREDYEATSIADTPPDPIYFQPADNNELATRNRINEYLGLYEKQLHPVTGQGMSPKFYFIEKSPNHSYGVEKVILQIRSQRRVKLAEIEGRPIFSDEREPNIEDHAYDCFRYFCAMHASERSVKPTTPSGRSFIEVRKAAKAFKLRKNASKFGDKRTIG